MAPSKASDDLPPEPPRPLSAEVVVQVLQALGAVAALVGWVVVVGGVRVWSRLEAADVPRPTRTVTLLPREELLAEGVQALALPAVFAILAAFGLYVLARGEVSPGSRQSDRDMRNHRWLIPVALALVAFVLLVFCVGLAARLDQRYLAWLLVVTLVGLVLGVLACALWRTPMGWAVVIGAVVLFWGGAHDLIVQRGDRAPGFEPVQVLFKDGSSTSGLMLARSASGLTLVCAGNPRSVMLIGNDDVRRVTFQPSVDIGRHEASLRDVGKADCQANPGASDTPGPTAMPPTDPPPPITDPPVPPIPDPTPPTDTSGPAFDAVRVPPAKVDREGRILVSLGHFDEPVTGVVTLVSAKHMRVSDGRHHRVRLLTRAFRVRQGQRVLIRLGFSAFVRRALLRHERIRVLATLTERCTASSGPTRMSAAR